MTQVIEQIPTPVFGEHPAIQLVRAHIIRGEPEIVCQGPRGSGKTLAICDMLLRLANDYPGMTQRWGRLDRTRMSETVLKTFEEEVLPAYPGVIFQGPSRDSRDGYKLPNGSQIMIHGLRDIESLKSMRADIWWPNEGGELSESAWEEIGGTSRAERFNKFPVRVKITDVNPLPPAHWTNTRCPPVPDSLYPRVLDDGTRMGEWMSPAKYARVCEYNAQPIDNRRYKTRKVLFFHAENPGYWDYMNWCWRKPGLEYVQKQLGRMTGSRRAKYLEGRPSSEDDVVYPEFERETHTCPRFDVCDWPVWLYYDPGYRHPCAVGFMAIAPTGQPIVVDEIWGPGLNLNVLAKLIKEKAPKYRIVRWLCDPRGANQKKQESNGRTIREIMAEDFQLYFEFWQAAMGEGKQSQVEAMRLWLTNDEPLQVFDDCVGHISNFESWKNKINTKGELLEGDDKYEDRNNDCLDGLMAIAAENPKYDLPRWGMS